MISALSHQESIKEKRPLADMCYWWTHEYLDAGKPKTPTKHYHWDNREKLLHDQQACWDVYNITIKKLGNVLNKIHSVEHETRYWKIILGPWLLTFIDIVFDRLELVKNVLDSSSTSHVSISPCNDLFIPNDYNEFAELFSTPEYNRYLIDQVARVSELTPNLHVDAELLSPPFKPLSQPRRPLVFLIRGIATIWTKLSYLFNPKIVFVLKNLSAIDLIRLHFALRQIPSILEPDPSWQEMPIDHEIRSMISLSNITSVFEKLIWDLIPIQIPKSYVEEFKIIDSLSDKHFSTAPKAIVVNSSQFGHEVFKFWAAKKTEQGSKLIIHQHGGVYGLGEFSHAEKFEIDISDRYFTWGWGAAESDKIVPIDSLKIVSSKKQIISCKNGNVLWGGSSWPMYSFRLYSTAIGPQVLSFFKDQEQFYEALSDEVRKFCILRLFPADYGWGELEHFKRRFKDIKVERGNTSFYKLLSKSRLFVATYNGTTFLETIGAGLPTILFWDPNFFELRGDAAPIIEDLRQAGVIHFDPQSAARKVNEVFKNPHDWWQERNVQDAVSQFQYQYCRYSDDWTANWAKALRDICKGDTVR